MNRIFKTLTVVFFAVCIQSLQLLAQPYNRIVSLSPAATFSLKELGCESKIVGCTNYCYLSAEREDLVVGSAMNMNIEKLLSTKPELIIYAGFFDKSQIERIKKMGIEVKLFDTPKNYKEVCDDFIELGQLVDKEQFAKNYVDSCNIILKQLGEKINKKNKRKMFLQIGAKPLFTVVPNTFMDDYITFLGCKNIAEGQKGGTITRERVIVQNPDIIVIITMGMVTEQEKEIWESYKNLSATKQKQIHIIDASLACQPTPYNFINTITELDKMINKIKEQ